jgi:REP element-mobilizing transposase RayT
MPRCARLKSEDSIYHVMVRSISEVDLYADEFDKLKYISLMKDYQKTYEFKVYAYCLMDTHAHFIIDANDSDISKVMHGINFSYAQYYNGVHKRHGHLFQDRFKSKIIKDERYIYALSAYIHNNPADIKGYYDHPERYEFSSLSVYLGLRYDPYELVDDGFILGMLGNRESIARKNYLKLINACSNLKLDLDIEFEKEGTEYRN